MTAFPNQFPDSKGLYQSIGARLAAAGGVLHCDGCHRELPLGDIAHYLQKGWPECCARTMRWITAKERSSAK